MILADSGFCQLVWAFAPFTDDWVRIGPNRFVCRIYNFRLGQLRFVSENRYGRLKGRWTILRSIPFHAKLSSQVFMAFCCLHNFAEALGETYLKRCLTVLRDDEIGRVTDPGLAVVTSAYISSTDGGK